MVPPAPRAPLAPPPRLARLLAWTDAVVALYRGSRRTVGEWVTDLAAVAERTVQAGQIVRVVDARSLHRIARIDGTAHPIVAVGWRPHEAA